MATARPGLSSGELFFRSLDGLRRGSWLAQDAASGSSLVDFLEDGTTAATVEDKTGRLLKDLTEIEAAAKQCRDNRQAILQEGLAKLKLLRKSTVESAALDAEEHEAWLRECRRGLDRELVALVLRHYATLEKEWLIHAQRTREDLAECDRLKRQLKNSLHLSMFSLHLESETSGQVLLRRLQSGHPQSVRCRRAAAENIKPMFFSGKDSAYSGIRVLDVYKIENRVLLERFQQSASKMEPGKVKGLFCSVPSTSVERIVAMGMGDDGDAVQQAIFKRTWFAYRSGGGGFAEKRIVQSDAVPLPLTFSRYSTLEVDKPALSGRRGRRAPRTVGGGGGGGGGDDNLESKGGSSSAPAGAASSGDAADGGGAGGGQDDSIRYLVLCRVVVGKVFVTSKDYRGFPAVGSNLAFDSMFNPAQEEYLIIHPQNVLPEFLVQYKYIRKDASDDAAGSAGGGGGAGAATSTQTPPATKDAPFADHALAVAEHGRAHLVDLSTPEIGAAPPRKMASVETALALAHATEDGDDGAKGEAGKAAVAAAAKAAHGPSGAGRITPYPMTSSWGVSSGPEDTAARYVDVGCRRPPSL